MISLPEPSAPNSIATAGALAPNFIATEADVVPNSKPLYKGFQSGYTSRRPRVTQLVLADALQPIDLGAGWRESRAAFAEFVVYRDLGPMRNLRKVAELTGKDLRTIQARSRVWAWSWRCALWDAEQHRLYGLPKTREEAMRWRRKTERYGPNQRLWTRDGRQRMAWLERNRHRLQALLGVDDETMDLIEKGWGQDGP